MIDLIQLKTFVAVAEEKHLTRASERLHISQATASTHIKLMEEFLGLKLFSRTNRNLALTKVGEKVLEKAAKLLNESAEFKSYCKSLSGVVAGEIVISLSGDPSSVSIGEIVSKLINCNKLITVDARINPSTSIRYGIRTGEIDVGIFLENPSDPDNQYYFIKEVEFNVVAPVDYENRVDHSEIFRLAELLWIVPANNSRAYTEIISDLLGGGVALKYSIKFDNEAMAKNLLQSGIGLMLMRKEQALLGECEGYLKILPFQTKKYPLMMVVRRSRSDDPLIKEFVNAALSVWPTAYKISV